MKKLALLMFIVLLGFSKQCAKVKKSANISAVSYPIRLAYINKIPSWSPSSAIAAGIGVPGYAKPTIYNMFAFAFWGCQVGGLDVGRLWQKADEFFWDGLFGKTTQQIQKNLIKRYHDAGIKVIISAFGATEFPTTARYDPIKCSTSLAKFVIDNNLDGADLDWEDNSAMEAGTGEKWLIQFTKNLRQKLPYHIIAHAPQGPYFKANHYKNGAYITIDKEVGHLIDFYAIQYYNQDATEYASYQQLFLKSTKGWFPGTAVKDIINKGIPSKKLVVGKPVTAEDVMNSGLVDHDQLGKWALRAYKEFGWYAGIMYWQYMPDLNGTYIKKSAGGLLRQCKADGKCV